MNKLFRLLIILAAFSFTFSDSLSAQPLDVQWSQVKAMAPKHDISLPSTMPMGQEFTTEKVDNDTFSELKATFEAKKDIRAIFLVESNNTWVFYRSNRWWMPIALGAIGVPVMGLGIARDNGTLIGIGAGLSVVGAVVGYFLQENSVYTNDSSPYKGKAAVFILKK